jgi:16S rRNA (cytidine1402-2'-O)-methyltransferase
LARYAIEPLKLVSYHAHNERRRREPLLDKMRMGLALALVSDAGTPGVADPGADLAAACAEEGIAVHPIPGPSAAAAAVAMAGIPVDEGFTFVGFLPPKSGARRKKLEKLKPIAGSLVAFVPPHKLVSTLTDAAEVLGDRNCCVCREMTKVRTTTVLFFNPRLLSGCWFSSFGFFFPERERR